MKYKILALSCLTAMSPLAFAQTTDTVSYRDIANKENWRYQPEFSIGLAYGLTAIKDDDFDEDERAYKGVLTFMFNQFIGIEGQYIQFDDAESGNPLGNISVDPEGTTLAGVLSVPFSQRFSAYAKLGRLWWDADTEVETNLFRRSENFDGTEDFWALGLKFGLTEHLDLKLEYERFQFEFSSDEILLAQGSAFDADLDYASLGLQYTF